MLLAQLAQSEPGSASPRRRCLRALVAVAGAEAFAGAASWKHVEFAPIQVAVAQSHVDADPSEAEATLS